MGYQQVIDPIQHISKSYKDRTQFAFLQREILEDVLNKCRVTKEEILQVIRAAGLTRLEDVDAVVLETNGKFSVIRKDGGNGQSVLENVSKSQADH